VDNAKRKRETFAVTWETAMPSEYDAAIKSSWHENGAAFRDRSHRVRFVLEQRHGEYARRHYRPPRLLQRRHQ